MSKLRLSKLSEQDYLTGELSSEIRYEYVSGEVYAMAGAGEAHNLISLNVAAKLRDFVRGSPCRVFISDMKLHVQTWKAYYYPDVMVICDPTDNHSHYKDRPVWWWKYSHPVPRELIVEKKCWLILPCPVCKNMC